MRAISQEQAPHSSPKDPRGAPLVVCTCSIVLYTDVLSDKSSNLPQPLSSERAAQCIFATMGRKECWSYPSCALVRTYETQEPRRAETNKKVMEEIIHIMSPDLCEPKQTLFPNRMLKDDNMKLTPPFMRSARCQDPCDQIMFVELQYCMHTLEYIKICSAQRNDHTMQ